MKTKRVFTLRVFAAFAVLLCAGALRADGWQDWMWGREVVLREGVSLRAYALEKPQTMKAFVLKVDLTTPGVGFTATERDPRWGEPMPDCDGGKWLVNTKRETAEDFMVRRRREGKNVEIAMNASGWRPWGGTDCRSECAALYRWTLADGVELSHGLKPGMGTYFIVRKDGSAEIRSVLKPSMTNDMAFAIYGNRALLEKGKFSRSATAADKQDLQPRTALGLAADRKTLVILAVDGRQPGYSLGASFADLAKILKQEGCTDAVNMDGGGSTSLVVWDCGSERPVMLNRHANGYVRKTALNLGITFAPPEPTDGVIRDFLSKSAEERIAIFADPGKKAKFRRVVPRPEDGPPRFMAVDGVSNMRDIGGWAGLGGRRVRHGLAYRSAAFDTGVQFRRGEKYGYLFGLDPVKDEEKDDFKPSERTVTDKGIAQLVGELGIRSDLDLRSPHECHRMSASPLGKDVKWFHCPLKTYGKFGDEDSKQAFAAAFRVFLDRDNYPIVFHCAGGADRTGAIAFIVNGICGVALDDLRKDWELTAFGTSHAGNPGFTHAQRFDRLVAVMDRQPGATLTDRIVSFVKSCGFTDADIERVREIMLEP